MRTLLTTALAFALAVPATLTPAAACGGDDVTVTAPVRHTAVGHIGIVGRNDDGVLTMFVAYPTIDGENSGLYGINVDLRNDRMARRFERDWNRWAKRWGSASVAVTVSRVGDDGAWRLVSYRLAGD